MKIKTLFGVTTCNECGKSYDECLTFCPHCHHKNENKPERCIKNNFPYFSWFNQILLFVIGYLGLVVASTIIFISTFTITIENPVLGSVITNSVAYLIVFIGLLLLILFNRNDFFSYFKSWKTYIYAFGIFVVFLGLSILLGMLLSLIQPVDPGTNQSAIELMVKSYPVISIIVLAFIGPIVEEITYRVGLFSLFTRVNKVFAYVLTILIFTLMHIDFFAEDIVNELLNLPSYLLGAIILTAAYDFKGPACSITVHILNNLLSCILILTTAGN